MKTFLVILGIVFFIVSLVFSIVAMSGYFVNALAFFFAIAGATCVIVGSRKDS